MKFTFAAACLFSATMAGVIENLSEDVRDIEEYLQITDPSATLIDDIRSESANAVEDIKPDIRDYTLSHMAAKMIDAFGGKDVLAVDMFHWVPTNVFERPDCWGPATVVSVPHTWNTHMNEWDSATLDDRGFNNNISSVLVPPGYKLELYDEGLDSAMHTVYGKMRDDGAGVLCQPLAGTGLNNKVSLLRLYPIN